MPDLPDTWVTLFAIWREGSRKIRELLVHKLAGDVRLPAKSTVHAVLDRHGPVKRARDRRNRAQARRCRRGAPNELWCADFKAEFKLGNGRYCHPLTVSDHASHYLLLCEAFESTREAPVIEVVAFGKLGDGKAPDGDTVYEIGSVTKTFMATLLAQAVLSGRVSLDTAVAQLLPDFKIPRRGGKEITLGELATQHSPGFCWLSAMPRGPKRPADVIRNGASN